MKRLLLLLCLLPASALTHAAGPPDLFALDTCEVGDTQALFSSPRFPYAGSPARLIFIDDAHPGRGLQAWLQKEGEPAAAPTFQSLDGPPFGAVVNLKSPSPGLWRILWTADMGLTACREFRVGHRARPPGKLPEDGPYWENRNRWNRDVENLYSFWISHLFDAPLDEDISWRTLDPVIRDPDRNLLFNYLGINEDLQALRLNPDCADFPYTLRAYFAWKLGLPMAMRRCTRGHAQRAPRCRDEVETNLGPAEERDRIKAFVAFFRKLKAIVHSSTPRSAPGDARSDLYPVALHLGALRPGAVYTDPYGHVMVLLKWIPQSPERAGALVAVDAQPDGTVGRRIFSRGTFNFPGDDEVKGAGWKRFRPLKTVRSQVIPLTDAEILAREDGYGDLSDMQWSEGHEGFYEMMDELINPRPMPPEMALDGAIEALYQQALRRVDSIETGRLHQQRSKRTIPMPKGWRIFLTAGAWEDFSTPSRDLRLLIAIDAVWNFPQRILDRPERYILDAPPAQASERLRSLLKEKTEALPLTYTRSDGSPFTLSLWSVLERREALELAWNPNDCVEYRWGAPEGSPEMATCTTRAPETQQRDMAALRPWFVERRRPVQR